MSLLHILDTIANTTAAAPHCSAPADRDPEVLRLRMIQMNVLIPEESVS